MRVAMTVQYCITVNHDVVALLCAKTRAVTGKGMGMGMEKKSKTGERGNFLPHFCQIDLLRYKS